MLSMKFLFFAIALTEAFVKPINNELISRTLDQSPCSCPKLTNVAHPCESGWTYYNETGACYKNFFSATFNTAEQLCITVGGHLTSIHSWKENLFVAELAKSGISLSTCCEQATWIGLVQSPYLDSNWTDSWMWTDGTKVDFLAWTPRHPVKEGIESNRHCVVMYPDPFATNITETALAAYQKWSNLYCGLHMRSFVCKKMALH
ncbi:unnamed protein product [Cylicocyclus nassatus]|uniref:C-type lectin domain-containing protein n=1 Tax=Cylicocyclus nassatus TaxID=53992 RepID=A0AA36H0K8_CYLNA|nr:unnamed protein product [Cylicocyclus nassatus]